MQLFSFQAPWPVPFKMMASHRQHFVRYNLSSSFLFFSPIPHPAPSPQVSKLFTGLPLPLPLWGEMGKVLAGRFHLRAPKARRSEEHEQAAVEGDFKGAARAGQRGGFLHALNGGKCH